MQVDRDPGIPTSCLFCDSSSSCVGAIAAGGSKAVTPLGGLSVLCLRDWLAEYLPNGTGIWSLNYRGITGMLKRLERQTGLPCNPRHDRPTFACLLMKAGDKCHDHQGLGQMG